MLSRNQVSAVLCSTDLERSRDFYEKRLGFVLSPKTIKNHLVYEFGNGESLVIYGRPSPNKSDHTQLRFWSTAIEKDVKELAAAGVVFDELDMARLKPSIISPRFTEYDHRPGLNTLMVIPL